MSRWKAVLLASEDLCGPRSVGSKLKRANRGAPLGEVPVQSEAKRSVVRSRENSKRPGRKEIGSDRGRFRAIPRADRKAERPVLQVEKKAVVREQFDGRVDDIIDGTAFVTLVSEHGETIAAQWPEQDLARKSIGRGDLFRWTLTDAGDVIRSSFRKVPRKRIPDDLWEEIKKIKAAYADLLVDDGDGDEEG